MKSILRWKNTLTAKHDDIALRAEVLRALNERSSDKARALSERLRVDSPFMYSLLRDTLGAASDDRVSAALLSEAAAARIDSLARWPQEGNDTVQAIENGEIDPASIKPHIRLEAKAYDEFYSGQSDKMAGRAAKMPAPELDADFVRFPLSPNVNHSFRFSHAIGVVENLFGIIRAMKGESGPVRWMDIGCGTGHFANAVDPTRFDVGEWEIVGCDMQAGKIAIANRQKPRGRRFFASDAFQMLDDYNTRGESFDLVSMFEFLEHLDDPLKFIRRLDRFQPRFVLAASPLGQKLNQPRDAKGDRVHLWSFSRKSWEQMFKLAGFDVVYSSEVRIGSYIGGLDWLSVACGPATELREKRQEMGPQNETSHMSPG